MPIYEYACDACGKIEEAIQKVSDSPLCTCRHCGGALNRLISRSSFHLKGTGWYVTDYAKKTASPPDTGASPKDAPKKTDAASNATSNDTASTD